MIRTCFIMAGIVILTLIFGSMATLVSFFSKTGNTPHMVARMWAKSILFISGVKVTVKGLSHIDPNGSYIYMSNHQSNFDIPVLLGALPVHL